MDTNYHQRLANRTAELRNTFDLLKTSILKASDELECLKTQQAAVQGALAMLEEVAGWPSDEQPEGECVTET